MLLSLIMATDVGSTVQYVSAQYVFLSHFVLAESETWIFFSYLKLKKEIYRLFNNWNS